MMIARARSRTDADLPVIGLGTWRMGEDPRRRATEVRALRRGLDLGMTLVDTAEMYAGGEAERVVGEAVRGRRRDEVFLVSKVLPQNATTTGTIDAAERSLRRLATDRIDLYLLHWPGRHPIEQTLEAFVRLRRQGKIRHYGVSNFDLADLERSAAARGSDGICANQVLYNLQRRGGERRLFSWCLERGIPIIAYSPLEEGRLLKRPGLFEVARRHGVSPECVAIAWTIRHEGMVAIPKASDPDHVSDNARAAHLQLTPEDLAELDRAYPPPVGDVPLETS